MTVIPIKDEEQWLNELETEWWSQAQKVDSVEKACKLGRHIMDDYEHTFGSIIAAGSVMSYAMFKAWASEGDVSGFQAKCANTLLFDRIAYGKQVDVARKTGAPLSRHMYYGDMFTPEGMDSFRTFSPRIKDWLKWEAQERLDEDPDKYDSATKAHLRKLAAGNYPKWMKFEYVVYRRGEEE